MNTIGAVSLICLTILTTGCGKSSSGVDTTKPPTVTYGTYTFSNPSDQDLNVTIYNNKHEYAIDSNAVTKFVIVANGRRTITDKIATNRKYYFDCYSNDYMYHNWIDSIFDVAYTFTTVQSTDSIPITIVNNANRLMFLKGNNNATQWVAVDAIDANNYTSVWSQLAPYQQYYQFYVKRDFTFAYSIKDNTGTLHVPNPDSNILKPLISGMIVQSGVNVGDSTPPYITLSYTNAIPGHINKAMDTLICSPMLGGTGTVPNVQYRYVFVRQ